MSSRHSFVMVLPDLWLLQFVHPLSGNGPWAFGGMGFDIDKELES